MALLVPVDFSRYSEEALAYACRMSGVMKISPLVLHVVHDPGEMPGYYSKVLKKRKFLGRIEDGAEEMMSDFLTSAADRHDEIKDCEEIETLLVSGLPSTRIVEVAKRENASMIIMGSRGNSGLKQIMTGSVAQQVMRLSSIPVTIVKA